MSTANPNAFPTTLADIQFQDQAQQDLYKTLRSLRKSTLSIPNRLRSILLDANFVEQLHKSLIQKQSSCSWPVIANERCGSWYIPPSLKSGSAYFKSTDGHYGQWDFSTRRLNLTVLETLAEHSGAILVDSTRRGKEFPDALRRTVPIWVAVWNRTLFPELYQGNKDAGNVYMSGLQNNGLEESEVVQIERRLSVFVKSLDSLRLNIDDLKRKFKTPIHCVWISNAPNNLHQIEDLCEAIDQIRTEAKRNILVLCSASRRVIGAEMSEDGYIQGAGDDSEGWSHGLTAQLFWRRKDELMLTDEDQLSEFIEKLVEDADRVGQTEGPVIINPTPNLFIGLASMNGSISPSFDNSSDMIICCNTISDRTETPSKQIHLGCRSGKLGSKDLRDKLMYVVDTVRTKLKTEPASRIVVMCSNGNDLSVGVAVTLLCLFYNDNGMVEVVDKPFAADKQFIKRRLAWITSSKPNANPSRSTLQSVNSFLMERPN